jgi:uncharacterized protein
MERLLLFAAVGFVAQLIDGALGMGYGATSSSVLIAAGIAPASAAASVILAQVGTTLVSGFSHWRFGNVEWSIVRTIAIPGGIAGAVGAAVLAQVPADAAKPFVAGFLFLLGLFVLARFALGMTRQGKVHSPLFLRAIGSVAGFFNASGGGWGPIATPALLANGSMEPRKVVGSVCTGEFIVVVATSISYAIFLGGDRYELGLAGALVVGGVIAAPIAAYLVRYMHPRVLGTLVGGIILLTNARTFVSVYEVDGAPARAAYGIILVVVVAALVWVRRGMVRSRTSAAAGAAVSDDGVELEDEEPRSPASR